MIKKIFNIAGTQIGWFACALGAARGLPWLGLIVVAVFLALHLLWSSDRRGELRLILTVGVLGMVIDSLSKISGLLIYRGDLLDIGWLAPLWIGALWLQFASTLNVSLAWLQDRYLLAFVVGAIAGPLSYLGGARLGALALPHDRSVTVLILAVIWGLVMPTLAWLAKKMVRRKEEAGTLNTEGKV
jgi:hypothetical protein